MTPLGHGGIEPVRWSAGSGFPREIVTPGAYRLGLSEDVHATLRKYCDMKGITARARCLTVGGGSLDAGMDVAASIGGNNWYIQRHSSHDQSNLQWISPADEEAHQDLLQALSVSGFDRVLRSVGEHFHFGGLAVYQISFITVSKCSDGRLHYDVSKTGNRAFNIIIPLRLAENSSPELEIQAENQSHTLGEYRYEKRAAILLGDDALHATGIVNYERDYRLALSVYVADICQDNKEALKASYTQLYRPNGGNLVQLAGAHWCRDNQDARLPVADDNHVLMNVDTM
mmetsp:Transcript_28062/g.61570  ORF Transcript_28062/g.61570 Transcript_28062/m.61570 type:complete len:286 (-) Transcript_28062:57-914(-)